MSHTVGVLGDGPTTRKHATALLDDFHAAHTIAKVVVSAHVKDFSDAARFTVDWAQANDVPYDLILPVGEHQDVRHLEDYDTLAIFLAGDPGERVIDACTHLFLAWNDEGGVAYTRVAENAIAQGKLVFDFTDGLYPITKQGTYSPEGDHPTPSIPVPQEPAQPREEAPDEAQQVGPEQTTYAKKPEGLSDVDMERICEEISRRMIEAVVPMVIADVCRALSVAFANATL